MNKCLICKEPTKGSIGAAKIFWSHLCQTCKDEEDKFLEIVLDHQVRVISSIIT